MPQEAPKYPLANNNDAPSAIKYGFLVRPDSQIVALRQGFPPNDDGTRGGKGCNRDGARLL